MSSLDQVTRPRITAPDGAAQSGLLALAVLATGLAVLTRFSMAGFINDDLYPTREWLAFLTTRGFAGFAETFSDYSPPYLYALYIIGSLAPDLSPLYAVRLPSLAADCVAAVFVYRIARLAHPAHPAAAVFAFLATLWWPTVLMNSGLWGQMDMLYTAPLLASAYYFASGRHPHAWIAFGVAFSIKLQSVFFAPFLLALLARRATRWRYVLFVPLVYFIVVTPAWIAGRPAKDLASIYIRQTGSFEQLTMDAPSLYAWLPVADEQMAILGSAGVLFAAGTSLLFALFVARSRTPLTPELIGLLAFASVLIVPFVLPRMHQRYFFAADVFALVVACFDRRRLPLAIAVTTASLLSYSRHLFGEVVVPIPVLTAVMLAAILKIGLEISDLLYPPTR